MVVTFALEILSALTAAHRVGIVHRDLKPANIFLVDQPGSEPKVKILDFGISKVDKPWTQIVRTNTGVSMGTPHYAAPEQLMAERSIDGRADLYALSVVLYQMLSGRLPLTGKSQGHLLLAVLEEPPAPLRSLVPSVSAQLDQVVMRGLAKEASNRWPSADAMANAIRGSSPATVQTPLTVPATQQIAQAPHPAPTPEALELPKEPPKFAGKLLLLTGALVGLLLVVGIALTAMWAISGGTDAEAATESQDSVAGDLDWPARATLALESSGCNVPTGQPLQAATMPEFDRLIIMWGDPTAPEHSLQFTLPPGDARQLNLSTMPRGAVVPSIMLSDNNVIWATSSAPVPSSGTLRINRFDLVSKEVDLQLENVAIPRRDAGGNITRCELHGQVTVTGT